MKTRWLVLIMILTMILSACAPARSYTVESPAMEMGGAPAIMPETASRDSSFLFSDVAQNQVDRIVIKNANLSIAVADPALVMESVASLAVAKGGFVVSSNLYKTTLRSGIEVPAANISVRVPAEELDDTLSQIKAMVEDPKEDILTENITGQDVTKDYTDQQSRLKNLEETEAQLQQIMDEARRTEDVLAVHNQLVAVREQIEITKGQIQYYEESAAMSFVSVNINSKEAVEPLTIGGWQPIGVARDALQATLDGLRFLANAVIWILLFVVPIGLIIFLPLRLLWKWFRRMRRNAKQRATLSAAAVKPVEPPSGEPPA